MPSLTHVFPYGVDSPGCNESLGLAGFRTDFFSPIVPIAHPSDNAYEWENLFRLGVVGKGTINDQCWKGQTIFPEGNPCSIPGCHNNTLISVRKAPPLLDVMV